MIDEWIHTDRRDLVHSDGGWSSKRLNGSSIEVSSRPKVDLGIGLQGRLDADVGLMLKSNAGRPPEFRFELSCGPSGYFDDDQLSRSSLKFKWVHWVRTLNGGSIDFMFRRNFISSCVEAIGEDGEDLVRFGLIWLFRLAEKIKSLKGVWSSPLIWRALTSSLRRNSIS